MIELTNRRYIGSKLKLRNWITSLMREECEGKVFADIFAGTGVIAAAAANNFDHIIVNDLLHSNYAIYQSFFGKGKYDQQKLEAVVAKYNSIDPKHLEQNYFSRNFGGKYFTKKTAKLIGHIRADIESKKGALTEREYAILLSSLIYGIDRIANTVGHYDAYIKKELIEKKLHLQLIRPISTKKVSIFRKDANDLAKEIKADVVYIDPPYNSRQYNRFYHVLETLTKWDNPKLYGTALKPAPENSSEYCKTAAPKVFQDLINNLQCKFIVVSYNNTYESKSGSSRNKIQLEQIKEILDQRGKTKIYKKNHQFFNSGKTEFPNHQEWLFITKTNGK